jgi:hypothetical protein
VAADVPITLTMNIVIANNNGLRLANRNDYRSTRAALAFAESDADWPQGDTRCHVAENGF